MVRQTNAGSDQGIFGRFSIITVSRVSSILLTMSHLLDNTKLQQSCHGTIAIDPALPLLLGDQFVKQGMHWMILISVCHISGIKQSQF
jgi:hypothetical protein